MKHQYKKFRIAPKAILFLCLSGVVLGEGHDTPVVEEVILETITVYINGGDWFCSDTLIIENLNLRVKRGHHITGLYGCGGVGRTVVIPLPDTTGTLTYACRLHWRKGDGINQAYHALVDADEWFQFRMLIKSFEESPTSCIYEEPLYHAPLLEPKDSE
jgi:hypothetical protein